MATFLDQEDVKPLLHIENSPILPTLGELIPLSIQHLLQQDFLDFEDMEYVGKTL